MKLRRLTASGLESFSAYLVQLRAEKNTSPPEWLLTDSVATEPVESQYEFTPPLLVSRLHAARYFDQLVEEARLADADRDAGLWAWFTLALFDQVCPSKPDGSRKPSRENSRYIPAVTDYQKYYRHLLLGPYVIYRAHRSHLADAQSILLSPVHIINDVVEQIASRVGWVSNRAVVGLATKLYVDGGSGQYKRGSGGKGPGSPRRLSDVLDQFDLTYDLFGMQPDDLLRLLPKEFERFSG